MGVVLHQSRRYHMNRTDERVIFWVHFAKMMWYLFSGNAHVGYLFNYGANPLHTQKVEARTDVSLIHFLL